MRETDVKRKKMRENKIMKTERTKYKIRHD